MKKNIIAIFVLILTLLVSISAVYAADAKTGKALKGTPTIDAVIDGVWKDAPVMDGFVQSGSKIMGMETPVKPTVRALWDASALYVLVEVKDSTVGGTATIEEDLCNNDGIELYIDQDNAKTMLYDVDDIWVKIDYQGTIKKERNVPDGIKHSAKKTSDGYIVEVMVPWSKLKPEAGKTIGFDVAVSDNMDGLNQRSTWITWNDETSKAYKSPLALGNLALAEGVKKAAAEKTETAKTETNPKTGDSDIFIYVAAIVLAGAGIVLLQKKILVNKKSV